VHTLIAHEPPIPELLPDGARLRSYFDDLPNIYRSRGPDAARQSFFTIIGITVGSGEVEPNDALDRQPVTSPTDTRKNEDCFFAHMVAPLNRYSPDLSTLRALSARIVVGGGSTSKGQYPQRGAAALAAKLDTPLVDFPGGHTGFIEYPDAFASVLRRVLLEKNSAGTF
jgi:clorobiocin biosynthesis protein CloN7